MARNTELRQFEGSAPAGLPRVRVLVAAAVLADTESFPAPASTVNSLASLHGSVGAHSAMDPLTRDRVEPQLRASLVRAHGENLDSNARVTW